MDKRSPEYPVSRPMQYGIRGFFMIHEGLWTATARRSSHQAGGRFAFSTKGLGSYGNLSAKQRGRLTRKSTFLDQLFFHSFFRFSWSNQRPTWRPKRLIRQVSLPTDIKGMIECSAWDTLVRSRRQTICQADHAENQSHFYRADNSDIQTR